MNKILLSNLDSSINIVSPFQDGLVEARFVQRTNDYFIVYLSSHNGCNQSCRFCYLTQHGDTNMQSVDLENYLFQTRSVLGQTHPYTIKDIRKIHVNFMSKGEPLLNETLTENSMELFESIKKTIRDQALNQQIKFKISTIIPNTFEGRIGRIFQHPDAELYYSLYSVEEAFRKKWLPKAKNPYVALDMIKEMQLNNDKVITIHGCFIKGHNDSQESVYKMFDALEEREISYKFNLVRYNSFDLSKFQETDEPVLRGIVDYARSRNYNISSKFVSRVGYDVAASCGMFDKIEG